jgi:hypothetical protein
MTSASLDAASVRPEAVERFRYVGHDFDEPSGELRCRYALDDLAFEEVVTFAPPGRDVDRDALAAALRLVHLLAGVSYYKAAAPPVIEVDEPGLRPAERSLLEAVYLDGLGEYALRNDLDLTGVRIEATTLTPAARPAASRADRPLVPFGGGIDSIVTVEGVLETGHDDAALFVVSTSAARFDAIERPAAVTGLPIVRAQRRLDGKILRSNELGFRNGHVPVTGILSATAVAAAIIDGRNAVVMSNEWSASAGNVERDGRVVNHQWSKSLAFEDLFRAAVAEAVPTPIEYFSWLRPRSELWVAERFATLDRYHHAFRSCNRAFHIDPARRLDHWCGHCDKCCFIDLVLAPFLPADALADIFGGHEPLLDGDRLEQFRTLVDVSGDPKPFECVGDVDECRVATLLAARRTDRRDQAVLRALAAAVAPLVPGGVDGLDSHADRLLQPLGPHRIPAGHALADLLD